MRKKNVVSLKYINLNIDSDDNIVYWFFILRYNVKLKKLYPLLGIRIYRKIFYILINVPIILIFNKIGVIFRYIMPSLYN